jgi:hypothetical protein
MSNQPSEGTRNGAGLSAITVAVCFTIIASVSTLDALLVAWNPLIEQGEKNPICLALIRMCPRTLVAFFVGKGLGTISVLAIIGYLLKANVYRPRVVLASITLFQIGLLTYLYLSDPLIGGLPNFALLFRDTPETVFRMNSFQ